MSPEDRSFWGKVVAGILGVGTLLTLVLIDHTEVLGWVALVVIIIVMCA